MEKLTEDLTYLTQLLLILLAIPGYSASKRIFALSMSSCSGTRNLRKRSILSVQSTGRWGPFIARLTNTKANRLLWRQVWAASQVQERFKLIYIRRLSTAWYVIHDTKPEPAPEAAFGSRVMTLELGSQRRRVTPLFATQASSPIRREVILRKGRSVIGGHMYLPRGSFLSLRPNY